MNRSPPSWCARTGRSPERRRLGLVLAGVAEIVEHNGVDLGGSGRGAPDRAEQPEGGGPISGAYEPHALAALDQGISDRAAAWLPPTPLGPKHKMLAP
jgi:hypothetical protein